MSTTTTPWYRKSDNWLGIFIVLYIVFFIVACILAVVLKGAWVTVVTFMILVPVALSSPFVFVVIR